MTKAVADTKPEPRAPKPPRRSVWRMTMDVVGALFGAPTAARTPPSVRGATRMDGDA